MTNAVVNVILTKPCGGQFETILSCGRCIPDIGEYASAKTKLWKGWAFCALFVFCYEFIAIFGADDLVLLGGLASAGYLFSIVLRLGKKCGGLYIYNVKTEAKKRIRRV